MGRAARSNQFIAVIHLRPIVCHELENLSALEQSSSAYPWSVKNVLSSFDAGHKCIAIMYGAEWVGSMIVMEILGQDLNEAELLNIVVFSPFQSKGYATQALTQLLATLRVDRVTNLYLEVRQSNAVALKLYQTLGFTRVGERKAYYSNGDGSRESAILMQLCP
ncbi:MAG: ribosomal-protein-alanine N-acetyltransferase [Gammaproteobacteria bacterium]